MLRLNNFMFVFILYRLTCLFEKCNESLQMVLIMGLLDFFIISLLVSNLAVSIHESSQKLAAAHPQDLYTQWPVEEKISNEFNIEHLSLLLVRKVYRLLFFRHFWNWLCKKIFNDTILPKKNLTCLLDECHSVVVNVLITFEGLLDVSV